MTPDLTPEQEEVFDAHLRRQIDTFSDALDVELNDNERSALLIAVKDLLEKFPLGDTLVLVNILYNHCRQALSSLGIDDEAAETAIVNEGDEGGDDEQQAGPSLNGNGRV